jgi:hypothetical protein
MLSPYCHTAEKVRRPAGMQKKESFKRLPVVMSRVMENHLFSGLLTALRKNAKKNCLFPQIADRKFLFRSIHFFNFCYNQYGISISAVGAARR